jgi:hypothetical protein
MGMRRGWFGRSETFGFSVSRLCAFCLLHYNIADVTIFHCAMDLHVYEPRLLSAAEVLCNDVITCTVRPPIRCGRRFHKINDDGSYATVPLARLLDKFTNSGEDVIVIIILRVISIPPLTMHPLINLINRAEKIVIVMMLRYDEAAVSARYLHTRTAF